MTEPLDDDAAIMNGTAIIKLSICFALLICVVECAGEPPADAVRHYERGMKLKHSGNPAEAATELKKAIDIHPKYVLAHYALAWVFRQMRMNGRAIEEFREVIRIGPDTKEAIESARAIQRIRLGRQRKKGTMLDRVVYVSDRNNNTDIYVKTLNGERAERLTEHSGADTSPDWSASRRRIAFVSDRDGDREVYTIGIDGTDLRRVTDNDGRDDDHPVWSPKGDWLAFESDRGGNCDVYRIRPDGTEIRRVTSSVAADWMGDWSPDGSRIAILSDRSGAKKVYLINADGTSPVRLVPNRVPEGRPVWGDGGLFIYFTWRFQMNAQVCRARVSGRGLKNITRSPYDDRLCDVSSDGSSLLIASDRDNNDEIYIVDTESGSIRRLTSNAGADYGAVFARGESGKSVAAPSSSHQRSS